MLWFLSEADVLKFFNLCQLINRESRNILYAVNLFCLTVFLIAKHLRSHYATDQQYLNALIHDKSHLISIMCLLSVST